VYAESFDGVAESEKEQTTPPNAEEVGTDVSRFTLPESKGNNLIVGSISDVSSRGAGEPCSPYANTRGGRSQMVERNLSILVVSNCKKPSAGV